MKALIVIIKRCIGGGQCETPSRDHRVLRVKGKIEDGRLQLGRIGESRNQVGIEIGLDFDIFPQRPAQQLVHRIEKMITVDRDRPKHLSAAKRQQSLRQFRASLTSPADVVGELLQILPHTQLLTEKFRVSHNHREEIVEVMGNSPRELSDHFHFLRLHELFFGSLALTQVVDDSDKDSSAVLFGLPNRQQHRKCRSVLALADDLPANADDLSHAGLMIIAEIGVMLVAILRRHQHLDVLPDYLLAPIAEQLLARRIEGLDLSEPVDQNDAVDDRLDYCVDPLPGLADHLLGAAALGDIAGHLGKADQMPMFVFQGFYNQVGPEPASVLAPPPGVRFEAPFALGNFEIALGLTAPDFFFRIEFAKVAAKNFTGRELLEPLRTGVPGGDVTGKIEHIDGVIGDAVDERTVVVLAVAHRLSGARALRKVANDADEDGFAVTLRPSNGQIHRKGRTVLALPDTDGCKIVETSVAPEVVARGHQQRDVLADHLCG